MTIPIGAKVIIHHTRGGIVVLPITPEAGVEVVAVDVPTITGCKIMDAEPNFVYIAWAPGANNDSVCLDVKTGAYVTTPATGQITSKFPISQKTAKVRLLAPNTTYFISLWGMRNGKYSVTAAQKTITSGASVTPPGEVDPPIDPSTRWAQSVVEVVHGLYGDPTHDDRSLLHGEVAAANLPQGVRNEVTTLLGSPASITLQFAVDLLVASRIDIYEDSLGDMYSFTPGQSPFSFTSAANEHYTVTILNQWQLRIALSSFGGASPTNIPGNISGVYVHP